MKEVYRHLDIRTRAVMEMQMEMGTRPSVVARYLTRSRSTITRELHRNGWRRRGVLPRPGRKTPSGGYDCESAEGRAQRLARRPRVKRKLVPGSELWQQVVAYLHQGLSPEQIERTLGRMAEPVRLSYETIYKALYAMPRGQLRARLLELMRRQHKTRKPQGRTKKSQHC